MRRLKTKHLVVPALIFMLCMTSGHLSVANGGESFDTWHEVKIPKTNVTLDLMGNVILAGEYYTSWVAYYPEGIVYADEVLRHDLGDPSNPLDEDLVLRIVPEIGPPSFGKKKGSTPWATVLTVDGQLSRDDLQRLDLASLAVLHGKLYAGTNARDPYENGNGTFGTDDTYRRLLYVTESVTSGEGISRPFRGDTLAGAVLTIEGILPAEPHLPGQLHDPDPTSISVMVRTAISESELESAAFSDPCFLDPSGTSSFALNFPLDHTWFQYKVILETTDSRVSPVLDSVTLETVNGPLVVDHDWNSGQMYETDDIFTCHSPGEVVLANEEEADGQTAMILVFQPHCVEVPDWCREIPPTIEGNPPREVGRAFGEGSWPYQAIGTMHAIEQGLAMRTGWVSTYHTACKCGDYAFYDYEAGLLSVEGQDYHERIPGHIGDKTWWGEGGGWLKSANGQLLCMQPDSKIGVWDSGSQAWRSGEAEEYYCYRNAAGFWGVGYLPDKIGSKNKRPLHIHDYAEFGKRLYASTNPGVVSRPSPESDKEHKDTGAWTLFGLEPTGRMGEAAFNVFDSHLLIDYSLGKASGGSQYGRLVLNGKHAIVRDLVFDENNRSKAVLGIEYKGRLWFWDRHDKVTFCNPKLRAIPVEETIEWHEGVPVLYRCDVEGTGGLRVFWHVESGRLPDGLSLNAMSGHIVGVPSETGSFDATLVVQRLGTPSSARSSRLNLSMVVHE